MPPTSRFTLDQRRDAVARAFEDGPDDATSVARELGVHPATLYRWATDIAEARPAEPRSRERLIRAAEALLRRLDYGDITVELIAEEAGVALRTAFHNYPSKRDLFQAVVDNAARALVDEMERRAQAMEWPADPIDQLRTFLRVAAESAYAHPEAHVLFRDLGVPASDGYAEQWHQRFESAVARLASDAAKAGQLESDVDPAEAARVISRMVRGLHAAVFEGADAAQAIRIADRLHRTIAS